MKDEDVVLVAAPLLPWWRRAKRWAWYGIKVSWWGGWFAFLVWRGWFWHLAAGLGAVGLVWIATGLAELSTTLNRLYCPDCGGRLVRLPKPKARPPTGDPGSEP